MKKRFFHGFRETGAVLVVSLIMLVIMTLFVVSMLKTSLLELKIGGASQVALLNFSNAQTSINDYIQSNNGRFAPGFLTKSEASGGQSGGTGDKDYAVEGGTVVVHAEQTLCGPVNQDGTSADTNLKQTTFDVMATGSNVLGGQTVIHQGVQTLSPTC